MISTEVSELGERIVEELNLNHSRNTLAHWMAHRIAELMIEAKKASRKADREVAAEKCSDLIAQFWENHSAWPIGWPPPRAAELLMALEDVTRVSILETHDGDVIDPQQRSSLTLTQALVEIAAIQREELQLWTLVAADAVNIDSDRRLIDSTFSEMETEERELLESTFDRIEAIQAVLQDRVVPGDAVLSAESTDELSREAILDEIDRLDSHRADLTELLR